MVYFKDSENINLGCKHLVIGQNEWIERIYYKFHSFYSLTAMRYRKIGWILNNE